MAYIEQLKSIERLSMNDVLNISREMLPQQYKQRPWTFVNNHGIGLLSTEEELCAYIAAYGEMHQAKCKAAYQNFNFEALEGNFEIIDWGCGQGIGSLTFIDMLYERDKLNYLRKVTLVEPSEVALTRAYQNINKATYGSIEVLSINRYLPGDGTKDEIEGIDYKYKTVIHIFSNILDIDSVNLEILANIVGVPCRTHYIFCMGPLNTNSYRIEKFCSAFNVDKNAYFSLINNPQYGHTTDTHHNYSCVTRSLKYNGEGINLSNMNKFTTPTLVCDRPIYDDYDTMLAVQNNIISKDLHNFYKYLENKLKPTDHIYLKPNINGDTPDIIVVRPNIGILIVKVFENDINTYDFLIGEHKNVDYNVIVKDNKQELSPILIVKSYQENLIQLHIKDMLGHSLINPAYWSTIKTLVYFSKNTTSDVELKFKELKRSYTQIFGNDLLGNRDFDLLKAIKFDYDSKHFDESICNSFLRVISPKWHSYKQGRFINLTLPQKRLAKSESSPKRKINGVAGSGKTQVLSVRAVNAHLRTGKKVLVLTFNLSLVNYIKYRIGQVREDFNWNMIHIINYHQLFVTTANNYGLRMNLSSFNNTQFFNSVSEEMPKYSAILIDEVQDYQTEWLNILEKYFLEKDGEFVVFGDAKQNIYDRPLDQNGQVRIGFIPGEWNNSLNKGFRFHNQQLTKLASEFQNTYFSHSITYDYQNENTISFDTCIRYYNVGKNINPNTLESNCRWVMHEFKIDAKDIVILSQTCDILRDIEDFYRKNTGRETMTTFESKLQYERLKAKHNIKDEDGPLTYLFRNDIKQIRRNKKVHFSMETDVVKLSTIHSYKGWEAPTVILIMLPEQAEEQKKYAVREKENSAELIYTAITRCKENLFIINCGNEKYHQFFYEYLK